MSLAYVKNYQSHFWYLLTYLLLMYCMFIDNLKCFMYYFENIKKNLRCLEVCGSPLLACFSDFLFLKSSTVICKIQLGVNLVNTTFPVGIPVEFFKTWTNNIRFLLFRSITISIIMIFLLTLNLECQLYFLELWPFFVGTAQCQFSKYKMLLVHSVLR